MSRDKICMKLLIHLVGERPALWDKTVEAYKDRALRETSWREICAYINEDFDAMKPDEKMEYTKMITKKWTHIRDSWVKSIKYGFDAMTKLPAKPYLYHNELKFLQKVVKIKTEGYSMMRDMENSTMDSEWNNETDNTIKKQFKDDDFNIAEEFVWLGEDTLSPPAGESDKQSNPLHHEDRHHQNTKETHTMRPKSSRSMGVPTQKPGSNHYRGDRNFNDNRHWNFLRGILPSLNTLDDDHTLQFQAGVISLIQRIKATQKLSAKPLKRKSDDLNKMDAGKRYATRAVKHSKNSLAEVADDEEEEQNSDSESNIEGDRI